ncbi:hypothetical protein ANN_06341 [Periplaneta americana]|uniref:PiggyBac transposable element-derived protein domain-containing protein n=1 Tax=Periplaneta americana TaxID=6978 RepID=A0ABQ8TEJ7_PERAM|nr:hypothetical protein ANN_06341 [Periplaneta americana]
MNHMRTLRGKQKIGKIGECWICSERLPRGRKLIISKKIETDEEIAEKSKSRELLVTDEEIARELNTILSNALMIMTMMNTREKIQRRIFLKNLAKELVMENVVRRMSNPHVSRSLRARIKIFITERGVEVPPKEQQNQETRSGPASQKRKRYHICPSTNDNKHSTQCAACLRHVCKIHCKVVCTLANRDKSTHVCDLMTSYDIKIHSQHYPPSSHPAETFSWLQHSRSRKYGLPTEGMRIKHCDKEERARGKDRQREVQAQTNSGSGLRRLTSTTQKLIPWYDKSLNSNEDALKDEWLNEYFKDREEDGEYKVIFLNLLKQPELFFDYFRMSLQDASQIALLS